MKYMQKSFTVGGASKTYSDNWERTFRGTPQLETSQRAPRCDGPLFGGMRCRLKKGHADLHVYSVLESADDVT